MTKKIQQTLKRMLFMVYYWAFAVIVPIRYKTANRHGE